MTDPKSKSRPSLRIPRKKKTLGLSIPPPHVALPHEQLIIPVEVPPFEEKSSPTSIPSTTRSSSTPRSSSRTSTTSTTSITKHSDKPEVRGDDSEIAPTRDFQRVPNSVTRRAIPEGLFRGKSKQVWDYLWSVSRGAVVPTRAIRKSRKDIKTGSGLGSMVTVDAAIEHLQRIGMLAVRPAVGSLMGNEYEVFTPEEALSGQSRYTSTSSTSSSTSLTHKVVQLDVLDSSISSTTQPIENTDTYRPPNTFINTIHDDDDDGAANLLIAIRSSVREITGVEVARGEEARWAECGEVLAAELRRASARAGAISSVPAFFAEHLRRVFAKASRTQSKPGVREQDLRAKTTTQSREGRIRRMIRELRSLHTGDPGYQESDLIEDIKYRCQREQIEWDEALIAELLDSISQ